MSARRIFLKASLSQKQVGKLIPPPLGLFAGKSLDLLEEKPGLGDGTPGEGALRPCSWYVGHLASS